MNFRSMAAGFLFATITTLGASGQSNHVVLGRLLAYVAQCTAASATPAKFRSSNWVHAGFGAAGPVRRNNN